LYIVRTLAFFFLVLLLAGCSVAELEGFATEYDKDEASASSSSHRTTGLSQKVGKTLLTVDRMILGGHQAVAGVGGQFERFLIGPADEIRLERPVAVGGVGDMLYIVDAVPKIIYKYDLALNEITPIKDIAIQFAGDPGNIYVAEDRSFYVVDSIGKRVLHFSQDGVLQGKFQDLANLSRPMDVYVDEKTGDVYVADGSYSHIVVFNRFGKATHAIGRRGTGPGRFRAITGMTSGKDGLYVLDRLELPVQVLSWDGAFKYSFGESDLTYPSAIAVNRDQYVFVADRSDNTIRVYQDGKLLLKFGSGGSAPGRFRLITGLWVQGEFLYVADSMNRRVQVLQIHPEAPVSVLPEG
jgi:DNA-binding beta-propeller fold protein YncE